MKKFIIILLFCQFILSSCSAVRESAGVNRKNIDEYTVVENPPLVIPPDFYLLPPEQLEKKNIEDAESELAKEILFGLEESNLNADLPTSTMEEILKEIKEDAASDTIRQQIDEEFANEKLNEQFKTEWNTTEEVFEDIKDSQENRDKLIESETISKDNINDSKEKKETKKRRFFFF